MARWTIPIDQLARKAKADVQTVVRRATLQLFQEVVLASPVDTGRFRANWNVSYGAPDLSTTANTSPTRAMQEVAKVDGLPVGGIVYLVNGLPYARELEYGHSKQAPQGMVRVAAVRFSSFVQQAVRAT
jgi:hypothetical protein